MVYVGIEEKMRREEEERKEKLAQVWGPCKAERDWSSTTGASVAADAQMRDGEDEDEWVDNTEIALKNSMPVEKRHDPATVVEINARMFKVEDLYMDTIVESLLADADIVKSYQDKE